MMIARWVLPSGISVSLLNSDRLLGEMLPMQNNAITGVKLFVGNLPYNVTADELRAFFETAVTVVDAFIPTDKFTRKPRGFGFVTVPDQAAADSAIANFHGKDLGGREISVNVARPREESNNGGGFRRGGDNGGYRA